MTDEGREDRVKVTDKRRVRLDDDVEPDLPAADGQDQPDEPVDDLARAQREAAEYLDHLQRLKAEFDNYRKRAIREQTRALETAVEPFVLRLLEVLDEFELALAAAGQNPELEKFRHGMEMVYAKLVDILRSEGVDRIDATGEAFDPERHEALFSGEGDGEPYVEDVFRTGYTMRGRVLRPAGVKVGRR